MGAVDDTFVQVLVEFWRKLTAKIVVIKQALSYLENAVGICFWKTTLAALRAHISKL